MRFGVICLLTKVNLALLNEASRRGPVFESKLKDLIV
jgi:hypothetical protein